MLENLNGRPVRANDGKRNEIMIVRGFMPNDNGCFICEDENGKVWFCESSCIKFIDGEATQTIKQYKLQPIPADIFYDLDKLTAVYDNNGNPIVVLSKNIDKRIVSYEFDYRPEITYVSDDGKIYGLGDLYYYPYQNT